MYILVKFIFVVVVVYLVSCPLVATGDSTASDEAANTLHSQIKYVESEMMRVWVTIDALVDEISRSSDAITDEMHKSLANLYFYDCELNAYLGELETELGRRENPSGAIFPDNQFEPIHANTMMFRVPADALPILNAPKIEIEKTGQ